MDYLVTRISYDYATHRKLYTDTFYLQRNYVHVIDLYFAWEWESANKLGDTGMVMALWDYLNMYYETILHRDVVILQGDAMIAFVRGDGLMFDMYTLLIILAEAK